MLLNNYKQATKLCMGYILFDIYINSTFLCHM